MHISIKGTEKPFGMASVLTLESLPQQGLEPFGRTILIDTILGQRGNSEDG